MKRFDAMVKTRLSGGFSFSFSFYTFYSGDMKMRWQVLAGALAVGLLAVSPVSATPIDFATDPNLATGWTQFPFYSSAQVGPVSAAWNAAGENVTLTSTKSEALGGLTKNGDTRSDTDAVTLTLSNYVATSAVWSCAGMVVSANATPDLFDGSPWYSVYFQQDGASGFRYSVNKNLSEIGRITLPSLPSTMKLDVLRDGSAYVFKANGTEICRDSSYAATSLSHYFMYWGSAATDSLSVSADNFGVVPEPSSLTLLAGGLLGLICYAWRKRR